MRCFINNVVHLLNRVQRRLPGRRRGSVLILTVVLVVLLALLGTALISTTRIDRYWAAKATTFTQIDQVVDGVERLALSMIEQDLFDTTGTTPVYRAPADSSDSFPPGYRHLDSPLSDLYLGERVPRLYLIGDRTGLTNLRYGVAWHAVTWPTMKRSDGVVAFDVPDVDNSTTGAADPAFGTRIVLARNWQVNTQYVKGQVVRATFGQRPGGYFVSKQLHTSDNSHADTKTGKLTATYWSPIEPKDYYLFAPSVKRIGGTDYPALTLYNLRIEAGDPNHAYRGGTGYMTGPFLAADADGDGIADSGLFRLGINLDGVEYFAGIRIIDQSSAINVNTAWSRSVDFGPLGIGDHKDATGGNFSITGGFATNLGWFRSHIGLQEILNPLGTGSLLTDANAVAEMTALNKRRFDPSSGIASLQPIADVGTLQQLRGDFSFLTHGDAMEHQLARRLANPGYNTQTQRYEPFLLTDALSLAYRFTLIDPQTDASPLEAAFRDAPVAPSTVTDSLSLYNRQANPKTSPLKRLPFAPGDVDKWFDIIFNYDDQTCPSDQFVIPSLDSASGGTISTVVGSLGQGTLVGLTYRPLRPLVTTHNAVSNLIPRRALPDPLPTGMASYPTTRSPAKTNINTASFEELWRAFWCVMAENTESGTPFATSDPTAASDIYDGMDWDETDPKFPSTAELHEQMMFRSSIRDFRTTAGVTPVHLLNKDQLTLRAALAAVQAIQLRREGTVYTSGAVEPVVRQIELPVQNLPGNERVTLFGHQPQPFITEVYAQTDWWTPGGGGTTNPAGYICIELYNPYDVDIILDETWKIAVVHRPSDSGKPDYSYPLRAGDPQTIFPFSGQAIQAKSYLLIDNLGTFPDGKGATYRPASSQFPASPTVPVVPAPLHLAYDAELVILRTVTDTQPDPDVTGDRPIDSYDFTSLVLIVPPGGGGNPVATAWHYARLTESAGKPEDRWKCVYPGRYHAGKLPRHQGTQTAKDWVQIPNGIDPTSDTWVTTPPLVQPTPGERNPTATFPTSHVIQLANTGFPGPDKARNANNRFPFGGFARNGDILQVPFIGAYVIKDANGRLIECNSISMDAAFAEDTDLSDDAKEQIGRFCPLTDVTNRDDLDPTGTYEDSSGPPNKWRYRWAMDIFDYLTVQAPSQDFLPNVEEARYVAAGSRPPVPVANARQLTANTNEEAVPLHGLININTAPWKVLSAVPWVTTGQDKFGFDDTTGRFASADNAIDDNIDIAKAIVAWRDGFQNPTSGDYTPPRGPFTSLFDLYRVADVHGTKVFVEVQKDILSAGDPDDAQGDFSPYNQSTPPPNPTADGVRYDFEEQFLLLNRVSNLLTVRSDSFVVYIVVQGWRNAGTASPELAVERRRAFILDRSPRTEFNTSMSPPVRVAGE